MAELVAYLSEKGESVRRNRGFFPSLIILFLLFNQFVISQNIRPASKAGQFYPENPIELQNQVNAFLDRAFQKSTEGIIRGIWVPHAGYVFSGQIAGNAYAYLKNRDYDVIILMGPSHYFPIRGAAVGNWDAFATPLGPVTVDVELSNNLARKSKLVNVIPPAHKLEHALEVQLPFIKTVLPNTPIVPVVMSELSYKECKQLADDIVSVCKEKNVLLIASSDMSHYPTYQDAVEVDGQILKAIEAFESKSVYHLNQSLMKKRIPGLQCVLCGSSALITVMLASEKLQAKQAKVLPYANSGNISGERNRVVGYGSALFISKETFMTDHTTMEDIDFSKDEISKLFQIARESMKAALEKKSLPEIDFTSANLELKRGIFVTLTNHGRLRGCLGNFTPYASIKKMVQELSVASATQDYRFAYNPITTKELKDINIKISILSELKKVDSAEDVIIGKHGIWIKQGNRSGTYLPEVATEMNWDREEFLSHCSAEKAGLSPDAWKKDAEIYVYTSRILDEKDL